MAAVLSPRFSFLLSLPNCSEASWRLSEAVVTGVQMALMSGVEAADAAVDGWLAPAPRPARAIARFDRTLQQRYAFVRRFVTGFYDEATRDLFFAPRPYLGIHRAVTRVLAGGFERIYQVCKCFRGHEDGHQHAPEFTIHPVDHRRVDRHLGRLKLLLRLAQRIPRQGPDCLAGRFSCRA